MFNEAFFIQDKKKMGVDWRFLINIDLWNEHKRHTSDTVCFPHGNFLLKAAESKDNKRWKKSIIYLLLFSNTQLAKPFVHHDDHCCLWMKDQNIAQNSLQFSNGTRRQPFPLFLSITSKVHVGNMIKSWSHIMVC